MKRIKWAGRSPAILVAVLALIAAFAGTALAAGHETRPTGGHS